MKLTRVRKLSVVTGCFFIISVLLKTAIVPAIIMSQIRKKIALHGGESPSVMRRVWDKYPFLLDFQVYIFNVTNPNEISNGEKPKLEEVGPYHYYIQQEKTNQIERNEDDTISFSFKDTYDFQYGKSSPLTGEEEVVVPNYFVLALTQLVLREKPNVLGIIGKAIDSIFNSPDNIFIKVKVKDILFGGLSINCSVKDFAGSALCSEVQSNLERFDLVTLHENIYSYSFFGKKNGTDAKSRMRVLRGIDNIKDVGKVVEYDNKPNMSVWQDDYCDAFNGTDGTIFPPLMDKKGKDNVVAFKPLLCRSVSCHYDSNLKLKGLDVLRYTTDFGLDPENNPLHKCFCPESEYCFKKGVQDIYRCIQKPIVISNPHFYLADKYYLNMVDGLKSVKEKHMLIVDIDPLTGIPMHASTRLQLNMPMKRVDKVRVMKKLPDLLLPLIWFDEEMFLSDFLVDEIKFGYLISTLGKIFQYVALFAGFASCVYTVYAHQSSAETSEGEALGKSAKQDAKNQQAHGPGKEKEPNKRRPQPPSLPVALD